MSKPTVEDRFWAKVDKSGDCWIWLGSRNASGYGKFGWRSGPNPRPHVRAHRFAYELLVGPIPEGLEIDHLCRNRACVRPDHMEPVTHQENTLRASSHHGSKTHCPKGHEYTPENTYIRPASGRGGRGCKTCIREASRASRRRKAL